MQTPSRIGKYEVEEFLGGGMSQVYRARDSVIGRTVAVKVLSEAGARDPEAKARFLTEARVGGNLRHENIVAVYDFGEDDSQRPYLVMEFLSGESLGDAIRRRHFAGQKEQLRVALQVARALEYIHSQKIIHRDIKPENIFLTKGGVVKLMDFGVSKSDGLSITRTGYTVGTPHYMPPEQVLGQEVTFQSDVYAFGALFFELLTGTKPITGETVERVFFAILNEPLDLEPLRTAGVPVPLIELIMQCTAKRPENRIPGFGPICQRLEEMLGAPAPAVTTVTATKIAVPTQSAFPRTLPEKAGCVGVGFWLALAGSAVTVLALLGWFPLIKAGMPVWASVGLSAVLLLGGLAALRFAGVWGPGAPAGGSSGSSTVPNLSVPAAAPPPAASPAAPPAAAGAFTTMFQGPPSKPSAPPPAPAPRPSGFAAPPPAPSPAAPPAPAGAFTSVFQGPPSKPSAPPPAPAPRPSGFAAPPPIASPSGPAEFTQMFRTSPAPPPAIPPAPPPVSGERPQEFTQMFQVAAPGAARAPETSAVPDVGLSMTACRDSTLVGKQFPIRSFPFRIGRPEGDLPLLFDEAISRQHAELQYQNGSFLIVDMGSSNGTFVDGRLLRPGVPEPLLYGSRISLGSNTMFTFVSNELVEMPDLTGAVVDQRYVLEERLLASAKSAVYRASDKRLPQMLLMKILSPRLSVHPGYRQQFEREAKVAARLHHPSISRVLDYGEAELPGQSGRALYICMPYLEGGSLGQRLARENSFEPARVAGWLEKLVNGLRHVHEQKIVHGSIKPTAVVFDGADNPYLTDFAIAVTAEDQSQRTVIGSPPFLAPEQWEGQDVSPATDQYSLAVLSYLVLTGSYPYEGQDNTAARKRNFLRGPMPAHEMAQKNQRPVLAAAVSPVLQRAMAVNPAERFPGIADFGNALCSTLTRPATVQPSRPKVFLSYRRDTATAWALFFKSELDGKYACEVFVDSEQQDRAGQFPQKLARNIQRCDVFVCLLADKTLESVWVNREIELACEAAKPMVPVFFETFDPPRDVSGQAPHVQRLLLFEGVKVLDRQNIFISAAIQRLSEVIRQSLAEEAGAHG